MSSNSEKPQAKGVIGAMATAQTNQASGSTADRRRVRATYSIPPSPSLQYLSTFSLSSIPLYLTFTISPYPCSNTDTRSLLPNADSPTECPNSPQATQPPPKNSPVYITRNATRRTPAPRLGNRVSRNRPSRPDSWEGFSIVSRGGSEAACPGY